MKSKYELGEMVIGIKQGISLCQYSMVIGKIDEIRIDEKGMSYIVQKTLIDEKHIYNLEEFDKLKDDIIKTLNSVYK